jgi:hypothetical protein
MRESESEQSEVKSVNSGDDIFSVEGGDLLVVGSSLHGPSLVTNPTSSKVSIFFFPFLNYKRKSFHLLD